METFHLLDLARCSKGRYHVSNKDNPKFNQSKHIFTFLFEKYKVEPCDNSPLAGMTQEAWHNTLCSDALA